MLDCVQWEPSAAEEKKNSEELRADEKRVKNKCEKSDHGTRCLEMKEDFSGRL